VTNIKPEEINKTKIPVTSGDTKESATVQGSNETSSNNKINQFLLKYKISIAIILITVIVAAAISIYYSFFVNNDTQIQEIDTLPNAVLQITQPVDQQAVKTPEIQISGTTNPNSTVVAYTETAENIFESDADGNFSGNLVLDEGPNEITFTAFGFDEEEVTEVISVVYLVEEL